MATVLQALPERPKPEVLSVEDLLDMARAGRIRVPPLQRGLRWKREHVLLLFDSLLRGYPIGSILVNQKPAEADQISFGSVTLNVPATPDAWWLVDGQQRVTALVAALLHPDPPLGGKWAVHVNLKTSEFDVPTSRPTSDWLPLSTLGDRSRLHQWARTVQLGPDTDAAVARAFELEKLLVQYKLSAFVVRDASEDAVRAIFSRTNKSGVELSEQEVVDALFSKEGEGKPLERLAAELARETEFGQLDREWLLRCVKAVAGESQKHRFDERHPLSSEVVARTKRALALTLDLLRGDAGILHVSVLPYRLPLIVLARFFDRHPTAHHRSRELLVRWLWRGIGSADHARSSDADVAARTACVTHDEDQSVQNLLAGVPRDRPPPDIDLPWNAQAAVSRLYACAALGTPPLSLDGACPVDLAAALATIDGRRTLSNLFVDPTRQRRGRIAARVFWPYAGSFEEASTECLASVGLDERSLDLLDRGDDDGFVARRLDWSQGVMSRAWRRHAAPGETDRPPILTVLARASAK